MLVVIRRRSVVVVEVVDQFLDPNRIGSRQLVGTHQEVTGLAVAGRVDVDREGAERMLGDSFEGVVGDRFEPIAGNARTAALVDGKAVVRRLNSERVRRQLFQLAALGIFVPMRRLDDCPLRDRHRRSPLDGEPPYLARVLEQHIESLHEQAHSTRKSGLQ